MGRVRWRRMLVEQLDHIDFINFEDFKLVTIVKNLMCKV